MPAINLCADAASVIAGVHKNPVRGAVGRRNRRQRAGVLHGVSGDRTAQYPLVLIIVL